MKVRDSCGGSVELVEYGTDPVPNRGYRVFEHL